MVIRRMATNHPYTLEAQAPVRNRNEARQHSAETLKRLEDISGALLGVDSLPQKPQRGSSKPGFDSMLKISEDLR